jgi:hypothetical protein
MPSSKGTPTDPELREEIKEGSSHQRPTIDPLRQIVLNFLATEVKQETNKDGSGKGQWAAWKVRRDARTTDGERLSRN